MGVDKAIGGEKTLIAPLNIDLTKCALMTLDVHGL